MSDENAEYENMEVCNGTWWLIFLWSFNDLGLTVFELRETQKLKSYFFIIQGQIIHARWKCRQRKHGGAQWQMLTNILMKFQGSGTYSFWVTWDTKLKSYFFIIQGQIIHVRWKCRRRKYGGAQWHMVTNIPMKFQGSGTYSFWVTRDTKLTSPKN